MLLEGQSITGGEVVVLGDDAITTTDEAITMTDEAVETTDEAVEEPVITSERALAALLAACGPLVDDDYLQGKTLFRDALCHRFGISAVESEELVDDLESTGRIRYISSEEGLGWRIAHTHEHE
jgi:hypothetical protein